jgi:hypothetical protein
MRSCHPVFNRAHTAVLAEPTAFLARLIARHRQLEDNKAAVHTPHCGACGLYCLGRLSEGEEKEERKGADELSVARDLLNCEQCDRRRCDECDAAAHRSLDTQEHVRTFVMASRLQVSILSSLFSSLFSSLLFSHLLSHLSSF